MRQSRDAVRPDDDHRILPAFDHTADGRDHRDDRDSVTVDDPAKKQLFIQVISDLTGFAVRRDITTVPRTSTSASSPSSITRAAS